MKEKMTSKAQIYFQTLLKEERVSRNISQKHLSNITGLSQSMISKYESGERKIDIIELMYICESLGLKCSEFIKKLELKIIRD